MSLFGSLVLIAVVIFCWQTKNGGGIAYVLGVFAGIGTLADFINRASYSSVSALPDVIKNGAPDEAFGLSATLVLLAIGYVRSRWPRR